MAIIQSIRNRAGLLIAVIIGVALFAFIVGDFITSGGFLYQKSKLNIAEVNGKKVSYPDYQKILLHIENILKIQYQTNTLNEEMAEGVRNQAWQEILQSLILYKEYDKLGLAVHDQEFSDLILGPNPHPLIMQMYTNPNTGTLDRLKLTEDMSRIDQLPEDQKKLWVYYEDMITKERLYAKYHALIRQGLYVTTFEAQRRQEEINNSVDISFIQKPYTSVADSTITINNSDIREYYKEHKEEHKQEETRNIKYVAFDITPSEKDYNDAQEWINDALTEFKEIEDVEQYINFNSPPFDPTNYSKGVLPDTIDEFMFNANLGDVYGPYFEDNSYKLAKLAKINYLSDSVSISHILLPVNQTNIGPMQALADSLKKLAENGRNFAMLARDNSVDPTGQTGGDMGWIKEGFNGRYFSDSCFYARKGDVKITYSESGLHVIKITGRSKPMKKIQVGFLSREVIPGNETDHYYYTKAVEFATQNNTLEKFEATTADNDRKAIPVFGLKPLDNNIQGLEGSRYIVHWAFQSEVGDLIDEIREYENKYIVAIVTKVNNKGYIPLEEVQATIELEIRKEKKAEKLIEEMLLASSNAESIDDVAKSLGLNVQSATGVRFTSFSVLGAGNEPSLVAASLSAEPNQLTEPIKGVNSVYMIYVENTGETDNQFNNTDMTKSYIQRNFANRADRSTFEVLQDLANITDNRVNFY
ncbi:Chaperone SurA [subsurface metagenome]